MTRQTVDGAPATGWFPKQRISVAEAIKAHTLNNAYSSFEERIKGSITVGKLADVTVLSKNLLQIEPQAILETVVLPTVVGGRVVYQK